MPNTSKSALKRRLFLYRVGHLIEINGVSGTTIATRLHRLYRLPSGYRIVIGYNPGMRMKEMLQIRAYGVVCGGRQIQRDHVRLAQIGLHEITMDDGDPFLQTFLLNLFGY